MKKFKLFLTAAMMLSYFVFAGSLIYTLVLDRSLGSGMIQAEDVKRLQTWLYIRSIGEILTYLFFLAVSFFERHFDPDRTVRHFAIRMLKRQGLLLAGIAAACAASLLILHSAEGILTLLYPILGTLVFMALSLIVVFSYIPRKKKNGKS